MNNTKKKNLIEKISKNTPLIVNQEIPQINPRIASGESYNTC